MFDCSTLFRLRVKEDDDTLNKFISLFLSDASKWASLDRQWIDWFCSTVSPGTYRVGGKSTVASEILRKPLYNYSSSLECFTFSFSISHENTIDYRWVYECIKLFFNTNNCKVDIDVFLENAKSGDFINSTITHPTKNLRTGSLCCDYVIVYLLDHKIEERACSVIDCIDTLDHYVLRKIPGANLPFESLESRKFFLEHYTDYRLYKYKEK